MTGPTAPTRARTWAGARTARAAKVAGTLLALALLGGCAAPAIRPSTGVAPARDARYDAALAGRAALARGVEADVRLWSKVRGRSLPGAQARLLLAAPDAIRLRVHGVLGAALDGALRGDSLTIHFASRREAIEVASLGDSLGIDDPGALLVRALSAAWPRGGTPEHADVTEAAMAVRPEIEIGADGLPRRVQWRAADGRAFELAYRRWSHVQGVAWPVQWRMTADDGAVEVECRVDRVRPVETLDPARLRITLPPGVRRVAAASLAEALKEER